MKEISKVKAYLKKSIRSIMMERHILKYIHHVEVVFVVYVE